MTLEQFNRLSFFQKHSHVLNNGEVILEKDNINHHITIFCIDRFFVELWKNKLSEIPDSLLAFRRSDLLRRYADEIRLDDLS
jgi:hypothetical protein